MILDQDQDYPKKVILKTKILPISGNNLGNKSKTMLFEVIVAFCFRYRRDDNAVPPCHNLRPITSKYPWFENCDPANAEKKKKDRLNWEKTFQQLSEILRKCAKLALSKKLLEENDAMLFFKSGKF